ncbi:MAG: molecular chaperone DnaJ [Planctomycetes bacterium]|nr:molecular chaperone DnaJ [Planctomycetota bacterium]
MRSLKPEDEELQRKKAELARLETELAERELELATLEAELRSFERTYLVRVGRRYAELDQLEAQIAEATAREHPQNEPARVEAEKARSRAAESADAVADAEDTASRGDFKPSDTLKKLYREAAKAMHPDLATDEAEKARRERFMVELNKAYADGDEERVRAILREWEASPESVKGEGTGADLVRTIRKIAQVESRLRAIHAEIGRLQTSELFELKTKVDQAATEKRDLLAEMCDHLDDRIAEVRRRLNRTRSERI